MEYVLTFKIQQRRLLCGFPQKPHHIQNLPLKLSFQSQRILVECDHNFEISNGIVLSPQYSW